MSLLFEYFNHYFYGNSKKNTDEKIIISIDDLKSVNLKPCTYPSNVPPVFDKIDLRNLNKSQLDCILNVKLKHIPTIEKMVSYEPRHPVLAELLKKFDEKKK